MRERPEHLVCRQFDGEAFGEDAFLVRSTGSRDDSGAWVEGTPSRDEIDCATWPGSAADADRMRRLGEDGLRLDALRKFATCTSLQPQTERSAGDLIEYHGELWRVRSVKRWGGYVEALTVRQEPQRVPAAVTDAA